MLVGLLYSFTQRNHDLQIKMHSMSNALYSKWLQSFAFQRTEMSESTKSTIKLFSCGQIITTCRYWHRLKMEIEKLYRNQFHSILPQILIYSLILSPVRLRIFCGWFGLLERISPVIADCAAHIVANINSNDNT